MLFIQWLLKAFIRSDEPYKVRKSLFFRLRFFRLQKDRKLGVSHKLSLILTLAKMPLYVLFKLKKSDQNFLVFSHGSDLESRSYFLKKNLGLNRNEILFFDAIKGVNFYYRSYSSKAHIRALSFTVRAVLFAILDIFFGNSNIQKYWYATAIKNMAQITLTGHQFEAYLLFSLYRPASYLTALFSEEENLNYYVSLSNSILLGTNRYTELPSGKALWCSKMQEEELKILAEKDWVHCAEYIQATNEDVFYHEKINTDIEVKYDLGIYTSGFWARDAKGNQQNSEQLVANQTSSKNYDYQVFLNRLLYPVIKFKKKYPVFSVCIYLHPYERNLYRNHQISPPYLENVVACGIAVDFSDQSSLNKIFETRIGISATSTIIGDRLDNGLVGYYVSNLDEKGNVLHQQIDERYFGEFSRIALRSDDELFEVLKASVKAK